MLPYFYKYLLHILNAELLKQLKFHGSYVIYMFNVTKHHKTETEERQTEQRRLKYVQ
jgi:hypothetical protein